MSKGNIKIKKFEEYPYLFLGISFSNETISAYQEIYLKFSELKELAEKLLKYPFELKEIDFIQGTEVGEI